jgi:hypothetical protein
MAVAAALIVVEMVVLHVVEVVACCTHQQCNFHTSLISKMTFNDAA